MSTFDESAVRRDPVGKFATHESAGLAGELLEGAEEGAVVHATLDDAIERDLRPALGEHADDYDLSALAEDVYRYDPETQGYSTHLEREGFWNAARHHEYVRVEGNETFTFGEGEDPNISEREIVRFDGEEYQASATVRIGELSRLIDDDLTPDDYDDLLTGPEQHAVQEFLRARYGAGEVRLDDDGGAEIVVLGPVHDRAITQAQAMADTAQAEAKVINETDAGTFGSEYAGRLLREHLDSTIAVVPLPDKPSPATRSQAAAAIETFEAGAAVDDQVAEAVAAVFGGNVVRRMLTTGSADRVDLRGAIHRQRWALNRGRVEGRLGTLSPNDYTLPFDERFAAAQWKATDLLLDWLDQKPNFTRSLAARRAARRRDSVRRAHEAGIGGAR